VREIILIIWIWMPQSFLFGTSESLLEQGVPLVDLVSNQKIG